MAVENANIDQYLQWPPPFYIGWYWQGSGYRTMLIRRSWLRQWLR